MPSNQNPLGALPARFRRERLLIVGCGDVGLRVAQQLRGRLRVLALSSALAGSDKLQTLRRAGVLPLQGDLDRPETLARLAGIATRVLHLAPPPREPQPQWWRDARSTALVRALAQRSLPRAFVYGSTSGVYGDCAGDWVVESRPTAPRNPRAHRRVDAERAVRWFGRLGPAVRILRIPGIYAPDREGGTPRARLLKGTPVLRQQDDVYTNHIHADDLARACALALWRGGPQRVFHVSDDSDMRMGDYVDLAADLYGLPRPPRIARDVAQAELPLSLLSFMGESRRLDNRRMKRELRLRLRYPTVREGLQGGGGVSA